MREREAPRERPTRERAAPRPRGGKQEEEEADEKFETSQRMTMEEMENALDIRERMERQRKSLAEIGDAGYYLVLVFDDRNQCDTFLQRLRLPGDDVYQDGVEVAKRLGVEMEPTAHPMKTGKKDSTLSAISHELPEPPEVEAASTTDES